MNRLPIAAACALSMLACAKTPTDSPGSAVPTNAATVAPLDKPQDSAAAAPAGADTQGLKAVEIKQFGLVGRVPAGAPAPEVGGDDDYVLVEDKKFTVRLWATKPSDPKTLVEASAFVKDFKPKNVKTEALADGWAMTFEAIGPSYLAIVNRTLAGKAFHCEATEDSAEDQRAAVAFCKSLTK